MLTAVMHVTIFNAGFAIFALLGRSKDTYPIAKPVRPAFARAMAPSGNHQSRCRVSICLAIGKAIMGASLIVREPHL